MALKEEVYRKFDVLDGIDNRGFNYSENSILDMDEKNKSNEFKKSKPLDVWVLYQIICNYNFYQYFNKFSKFVKTAKKPNKKDEIPTVSYFKLFRFATGKEIFLVFLGIVCALVSSFGLPYGMILYGEFTTVLVDRTIRTGTSTRTNILSVFGGGRVLTNATGNI